MLVVGQKEQQTDSVNIRIRGIKQTETVEIDAFINTAKAKIADKTQNLEL